MDKEDKEFNVLLNDQSFYFMTAIFFMFDAFLIILKKKIYLVQKNKIK